jgi:hypothetical protein
MTLCRTSIRTVFHRYGLILLLLTAVFAAHAADKELSPEELISRHLQSVGPAEVRQRLETRKYVGEGVWRMLVGGVGEVSGPVVFISSADTCDFRFDSVGRQPFYGERFGFDGRKPHVKRAFQRDYSVLGQFMRRNSHILGEGLLGGTASLSWALRNVAARGAKVKYLGLKNVDGRSLHVLDYQPRKRRGNLRVELYFDPETYHHVRTQYRETFAAGFGAGGGRDPAVSLVEESKVSFVETFDNFESADGVMVPVLWKLKLDIYSEGRRSGSANVSEIEVAFQRVHHNEPIESGSIESR